MQLNSKTTIAKVLVVFLCLSINRLSVAQFGRVLALDASCRRFESYHSDLFIFIAHVVQLAEARGLRLRG